ALGNGDRDLRVRVLRPACVVLADRHAHPAAARDRGDRVRADPVRRQAPAQPAPDDGARPWALAATTDDPRADARPAGSVDPRVAGGTVAGTPLLGRRTQG